MSGGLSRQRRRLIDRKGYEPTVVFIPMPRGKRWRFQFAPTPQVFDWSRKKWCKQDDPAYRNGER